MLIIKCQEWTQMPKNKKWIQDAIAPSSRGALRKKLGAKKGESIPVEKLEKATKSKNPKTVKQANLALTLRKMKNK